jgi:amino-acid N-acetyltransferase
MEKAENPEPLKGRLRRAAVADVPAVHKLIMFYANKRKMLPASLSRLYEQLRDFFVYEIDGEVVACGALHVLWEDLGEVRSLAVKYELRGKGIGRVLVDACKDEAKGLGLPRIFCLTYSVKFFQRNGFREVDKNSLPHKIWADCINCPQFPDCSEVPMVFDLEPRPAAEGGNS